MDSFERPAVDIGPGASLRLLDYLERIGRTSIRIVADANTWRAAGVRIAGAAKAAGFAVESTIYGEAQLAADSRSIFRLLVDEESRERLFIAVGSGTITDIVRFVAHREGRAFVSVPTAPSVDAYASSVAPLLVEGVKRSVAASPPLAIFADTEVLRLAPKPMIASGFGDMVCKFSAVADWRLGSMLWGEGYDETIALRALAAARSCVDAVGAIGAAEASGLATLMGALVESGLCMAEAGHSRPASGAEHQYSHFWEMRLLDEGRAPVLHGLKVGVGTRITARLWERVRSLTREAAERHIASSRASSRGEQIATIRRAYGERAAEIEAGQSRFLSMDAATRRELAGLILDRWEEIRAIAAGVPDEAETVRLLTAAGCPVDPSKLGLGEAEIAEALASAHYLRDRFTVRKLALMLFGE